MNQPTEMAPASARPLGMSLRFTCPMCTAALEIPRSRTGEQGPCPVCGATIIAPSVVMSAAEAAAQAAPPPAPAVVPTPETKVESDPLKAPPSVQTTRLCDLPPRPAFQARSAKGLPAATGNGEGGRKRRSRGHASKRSRFRWKDMGVLILLLVILAVLIAILLYGDQMFDGVAPVAPMR